MFIAVTVLSALLTTVTVKPSSQSSSSSNDLPVSIFSFFLFLAAITFTGSTLQGFLTTVRSRCGESWTREGSAVAIRSPTTATITYPADHRILNKDDVVFIGDHLLNSNYSLLTLMFTSHHPLIVLLEKAGLQGFSLSGHWDYLGLA